jgi:hypothetical protein
MPFIASLVVLGGETSEKQRAIPHFVRNDNRDYSAYEL